MFTLIHWDDWRLLVLEIILAVVVIVGIMWIARLANRGGPPQTGAAQSSRHPHSVEQTDYPANEASTGDIDQ